MYSGRESALVFEHKAISANADDSQWQINGNPRDPFNHGMEY